MSFVIFMLVEIMPGDVAQMILGQSATEESVAALREARGLDDPVLQRYGRWIKGVVVGDLGESIYMQGVAIN
jgi:peptide/nickel transport system permease protein